MTSELFFVFFLKPRSSYTGHTTGVFPKWSDTTWVPAPELKPTIPLVRGQYQAFTDGSVLH